MKNLNQALIVASFVALPLVSHAADRAPLTRAQVRADLIAAEQNGSYPTSKVHYPDPGWDPAAVFVANKAAQKMTQEASNKRPATASTSYGDSTSGSSASGSRAGDGAPARPQVDKLYRGH